MNEYIHTYILTYVYESKNAHPYKHVYTCMHSTCYRQVRLEVRLDQPLSRLGLQLTDRIVLYADVAMPYLFLEIDKKKKHYSKCAMHS